MTDWNLRRIIMEYIQVTKENIESEHICCAISNVDKRHDVA